MEYVRKIVTYNDTTNGNVSNILTDFGFVDQTGKGFAGRDLTSTLELANATDIYWKNDTKRQSCVRATHESTATDRPYYWRPYRFFCSSKNWYGQNTVNETWDSRSQTSLLGPCCLRQNNDSGASIIYSQLSLIPLLNGGFIWNNRFLNSSTTPKSLVLMNSQYLNSSTDTFMVDPKYNCSIIGIPPSSNSLQTQSNYIYISWMNNGHTDSSWTFREIGLLWDFLNSNIIVCRDVKQRDNSLNTEPNYEDLRFDINHASYTNLNQNVCVLIKMPRDNGYLENVYFMSTAPSNFRSGGIFSFAGRTFINVYSNVVLELPND